jgi:hypothetical protein
MEAEAPLPAVLLVSAVIVWSMFQGNRRKQQAYCESAAISRNSHPT